MIPFWVTLGVKLLANLAYWHSRLKLGAVHLMSMLVMRVVEAVVYIDPSQRGGFNTPWEVKLAATPSHQGRLFLLSNTVSGCFPHGITWVVGEN